MEYKSNLIFDIGFHKCEDIDYYLSLGYNVIGIDADFSNVENAANQYINQINSGQLILEHCAITKPEETIVDFYKCEHSIWSSLNKKIATRNGLSCTVDSITGKPLSYFIKKYEVPYYCKIDIEGYDTIALQSLEKMDLLPKYISVETECIGDRDTLIESEITETLVQLHKLGYNKFKLIDQETLKELKPGVKFYGTSCYSLDARKRLSEKLNYPFRKGTSGPLSEFLSPKWLTYNEALATILFHRGEFFSCYKNAENYAFWCDWHATKT